MFVGVMQFELLIHDARSLKDKRSVVRSVKDRLHREHQVSVAEVGALDSMARARMGIAVAAGDPKRVNLVLDACTNKLRQLTGAELGACRRAVRAGELIDDEEPETLEPVSELEARMLRELNTSEEREP